MPVSDVLTVRAEQLETFAAAQLLAFERDAVEHVRAFLPEHYAALGEAGTLAGVRQGIAEARGHGLLSVSGVTVYIGLLFIYGDGFGERCGWARAALVRRGDGAADDEAPRIFRLARAALAHAQALVDAEAGLR